MLLACGLAGRREHGNAAWNAAGSLAGRVHERSARRQPGVWQSDGRHCTAGQYVYVPLGRHFVSCYFVFAFVDCLLPVSE